MDRSQGRKKSEFIAKNVVDAGSYIDYFVNGTNYKISYDNFVAGLGVSGSIEQDGAVTGTAVLDIDGSVNKIRNIENGPGILTAISVDNGLKISHNFTADSTGFPILKNITLASPTFVSLVAGTGIDIAAVGDTLEIASEEALEYAVVYMQGNSTATVISSTATPVKAAGTFTVGDVSTGFTADTTGKITDTEAQTHRHIINAIATLDAVSGSNHLISMYIAINGTVIPETKMTDTVSAGLPRSIATFLNTEISNLDYVEIFVRNESTTDNIIVKNAKLSVL